MTSIIMTWVVELYGDKFTDAEKDRIREHSRQRGKQFEEYCDKGFAVTHLAQTQADGRVVVTVVLEQYPLRAVRNELPATYDVGISP